MTLQSPPVPILSSGDRITAHRAGPVIPAKAGIQRDGAEVMSTGHFSVRGTHPFPRTHRRGPKEPIALYAAQRSRGITHQLRKLERSLVSERTEVGLGRLVDQLVNTWERALREDRPLPSPLDFVRGLMAAGFYTPAGHRAISYLEECQRKGAVPDRRRLVRLLLSG